MQMLSNFYSGYISTVLFSCFKFRYQYLKMLFWARDYITYITKSEIAF